jgi:mannose-6-phosphate isomerase class I
MDFIKNENAPRFENSPVCTATEYDFKDEKDFNIAGIELHGRYPEKGFALNTISKELIYVKSGEGTLTTDTTRVELKDGDAALILPQEKYYLEGNLELVISSSPAWHPDQHQTILD